ncbi:MAG: hypothetical protein M3082_07645 [Candidatus Dormibacteraeota bacterium]|nr:hypothetical protein [Candidatus Dormibacteraeota bacterium]
MLVAQFLLGMTLNLSATILADHSGAKPPEDFSRVAQCVTWAISGGPLCKVHAV